MIASDKPCSFQWGDRVDHNKFGLGTVVGEPIAGSNFDGKISWGVLVRWDDKNRPECKIMHNFLRLVERPDAKGGAYWANEHRKLLDIAIPKLRKLEHVLISSFRPGSEPASAAIEVALEQLEAAVKPIHDFAQRDEAGDHH